MSGTPGGLTERFVRDVLEDEAGRAVVRVTSSSMRPRLLEGDKVEIRRVPPGALLPGDIIVFMSETAGLVVHRLIWRDRPLGRPTRVYTKGDAVRCLDRSVGVDQVVGKVARIIRGEGRYRPTSPLDRLRCLCLAAWYGLRRGLRGGSGRGTGDLHV